MTLKKPKKYAYPTADIRRYLEPGPVVLVSSAFREETNIMTMGWHSMMEFTPSLIGCVIAAGNHSFHLIWKSKECVINLPTTDLLDVVVGIGNCSAEDENIVGNKFAHFGLTAVKASKVGAPMIAECHASFECRLYDARLVDHYNFFIFEVVAAHVAKTPRHPKTLHYAGAGQFMTAGKIVSRRSRFKPAYL